MKRLLLLLSLPLSAELSTKLTTRPNMVINHECDVVISHKTDLLLNFNYEVFTNKLSYDTYYTLNLNNDMTYIIGTKVNWKPAHYCKITPSILYSNKTKTIDMGVEIQLECKF